VKGLLLAAMLCLGGSGAPYATPVLGTPWKTIHTVDGNLSVYRLAGGCVVAFRGVVLQVVDGATCQA